MLQSEVEIAVRETKPRRSPGSVGLCAKLLRAGGEDVEQLTTICNDVWREEGLPDEWSKSIIITLPKKGSGEVQKLSHTLTSQPHVLLLIILERLKSSEEPFLAEELAGFRRNRSTYA